MIEIIKKEFFSYLNSLIAYVVISVFLTGMGLLTWVFPESSILEYGYADMETLFSLGPYVLIFFIPAITMKQFAEEYKTGTIELLLTRPLTDWQIILGKFFASWILSLMALFPTVVYYFSVYLLGDPAGNLDTPGIIGSYIGLGLLCGVFTSVGIFSSSLTRNQIVAFVLAVFLCFFLFYGFRSIAGIALWKSFSLFIDQLGIVFHYNSLSKGLLDSRNIIYFLSVIMFMLFSTKLITGSRKW
ncbi:MAG: gliding motility-associated ABC transporter permease subunit GldF [Cyclobacteriaceae bacterium]|nr:gliding motility-associated ABC transporter permease subunit GldF [Cyclobacteriaceae bacterium]